MLPSHRTYPLLFICALIAHIHWRYLDQSYRGAFQVRALLCASVLGRDAEDRFVLSRADLGYQLNVSLSGQ